MTLAEAHWQGPVFIYSVNLAFFEDCNVFRLDTYRHLLQGGGLFFAETLVAVGSVLDGIAVVVVVLDLLLLPTPMQQRAVDEEGESQEEIVEVSLGRAEQ